jgi:single-strand DNA-binding protein
MSFAKITLMGNLGKDPETFTFGQDKKTGASFSVAVSSGKDDNKKTDWFKCSVYGGGLVKTVTEYLKKGKPVVVFGRLSQRQYESNGKSGSQLEVNVDSIEFVPDGQSHSEGTGAGASSNRSASHSNGVGNRASAPVDMSDEVPF